MSLHQQWTARPARRRALGAIVALAVGSAVVAIAQPSQAGQRRVSTALGSAPTAVTAFPPVRVEVVASGLDIPWDLAFTPAKAMIVTQRSGPMMIKPWNKPIRAISADLGDLLTGGERGVLGVAVDPRFADNRRFYTCQTFKGTATQPADVRVVRWKLSTNGTSATREGQPVVKRIPVGGSIHSGCRVRFAPNGKLRVATGDAATGTAPQSLQSLAGKTLRVNADGTVPSDNPFFAMGGNARYVWTFGHRNPQGLAPQPGTRNMWSAEHGPDRDDEINLTVKGGNYGWNPVPGYNQTVPMTDLSEFPNAVVAKWSSGSPTLAPAGIAFLDHPRWGSWRNALVMALLKDTGVRVFTVSGAANLTAQGQIPELNGSHGRLRTVQPGPDGALYVTTSNGGGNDEILRVTPR